MAKANQSSKASWHQPPWLTSAAHHQRNVINHRHISIEMAHRNEAASNLISWQPQRRMAIGVNEREMSLINQKIRKRRHHRLNRNTERNQHQQKAAFNYP